jgi:hypothetical protein
MKIILVVWAVYAAIAVGWVMNMVDLARMEEFTLSGVVILQIIGVFMPPIGAVMAFFV